jgi:hypothetical protein
MNAKEFLKFVTNDEVDLIQILLDILEETQTDYCVIGGLAVNAYAEPVVSLDLDIVVVARGIELICGKAREKGLSVEAFPHSLNLGAPKSDIRIQLQTDERYQTFIARSIRKPVLGYEMRVATLEDVLQGKVWAYLDETRRPSKRQKDLADILRMVETHPSLRDLLPESIRMLVE